MSDNQEFLIVLYQLSNIFPEQRERRIGYHDIRFLQQFDTLWVTEVTCLQNTDDILVILKKISDIAEVYSPVAFKSLTSVITTLKATFFGSSEKSPKSITNSFPCTGEPL